MVRPVPIPNTAVKRCMADGSGLIDSARVGSRQSFKALAKLGLFYFLSRVSGYKFKSNNYLPVLVGGASISNSVNSLCKGAFSNG